MAGLGRARLSCLHGIDVGKGCIIRRMDSVPASSSSSVPSAQDFQGNIERFSGFARDYDHYRPEPPHDLSRLLAAYGGFAAPPLVIDPGRGPGLAPPSSAANT